MKKIDFFFDKRVQCFNQTNFMSEIHKLNVLFGKYTNKVNFNNYWYLDEIIIIAAAYFTALKYSNSSKIDINKLNSGDIQKSVYDFLFLERECRMPLYDKGWWSMLYYGKDQEYKDKYIINAITNHMQSKSKYSQFYYVCNDYFRSNNCKVNKQTDPVFIYFNRLNEALNRLPIAEQPQTGDWITLYRYVASFTEDVTPGKIIDLSFASTSLKQENDFIVASLTPPILLKISVPVSKCRPLYDPEKQLTYFFTEYEVMLTNGTLCEVISVQRPPFGRSCIELKYNETESMMCDFTKIGYDEPNRMILLNDDIRDLLIESYRPAVPAKGNK
jgi:hypothetical protein